MAAAFENWLAKAKTNKGPRPRRNEAIPVPKRRVPIRLRRIKDCHNFRFIASCQALTSLPFNLLIDLVRNDLSSLS